MVVIVSKRGEMIFPGKNICFLKSKWPKKCKYCFWWVIPLCKLRPRDYRIYLKRVQRANNKQIHLFLGGNISNFPPEGGYHYSCDLRHTARSKLSNTETPESGPNVNRFISPAHRFHRFRSWKTNEERPADSRIIAQFIVFNVQDNSQIELTSHSNLSTWLSLSMQISCLL